MKYIILFPLLVVAIQLYHFSASRKGRERQESCRLLGIVFFSIGTVGLLTRDPAFTFAGLFMMMGGFRLIAYGLDRIDKKTYIDRYSGD